MKTKVLHLWAISAIVVSTLAFHSCKGDDNVVSEGTLVVSGDRAAALVNAIYGPLQTLSSSYSFLLESTGENAISFEEVDDSKDGPQVSILETTSSNWYPIKVFNRLYKSIGAANLAIDSISNAKISTELTQVQKDNYVARAKFIRGYDYFQLVQLYGEVPLILTSSPTTTQATTRQSIDDVYTQIVKDLTDAYNDLDAYSSNKSVPTQGAVNTVLAKVYLTWGQKPLSQSEVEAIKTTKSDPSKPSVDADKLKLAISYADKVINSGQYQLLSDFNKIWGSVNENNAEVIFSIHHDGDGIDAQGNHQTHCGFTWPKSARTDPHISYADATLANKLADSDKRKLYSYASQITYLDGTIDTLAWPVSIVRPGKWIHRVYDGQNIATDTQLNDIDHIDFRYAEVLLIKAEAQFYASQGDKGLAAVNLIRTRAGITNLTAISESAIQQEWENEFAFEQKGWLNRVRWRTLVSSILNKVPDYEYYQDKYASAATIAAAFPTVQNINSAFYARVHKHLVAKVTNINGHFYRFPIPLSEKYTSLGITPQNPGY
ncbi:MAG: RagB/SusD family nutrient uptake outer membrane protein [Dysgonamonadaceae bacterium]